MVKISRRLGYWRRMMGVKSGLSCNIIHISRSASRCWMGASRIASLEISVGKRIAERRALWVRGRPVSPQCSERLTDVCLLMSYFRASTIAFAGSLCARTRT